jgi:hypothetical protein
MKHEKETRISTLRYPNRTLRKTTTTISKKGVDVYTIKSWNTTNALTKM